MEELEVSLFSCYCKLPISLVNVGGVVVVEEVIFSHCAHIGEQAFAEVHSELFKSHSFPFSCGLDELCADRFIEAEAAGKFDGRSRAIAVEQVVGAAFKVDNQRDGDTNEIKLFAEILLNVVLNRISSKLSFFR